MKYLEWVDAYIAGELPDDQREEFEAALATSPELQEELDLARKIAGALAVGLPDTAAETFATQIAEQHRQERRELFQQYHAGTLPDNQKHELKKQLAGDELLAYEWESYKKTIPGSGGLFRIRPMYWAAAASIAVALGVFAWWTVRTEHLSTEELYARYDVEELYPKSEYALVDEGLHHLGIMGSDDFSQLKLDGLKAYDKKEWDKAIPLLSSYIRQAIPSNEELPDEINLVHLYIGRAWLEKNDLPKAIAAFETADKGVSDKVNYGYLQELIRWHLALAHLKNHDSSAAKAVLLLLQNARQETIRLQSVQLLNDLK